MDEFAKKHVENLKKEVRRAIENERKVYDFVLQHGRNFVAWDLPDHLRPLIGNIGHCYDTTILANLANPQYTYCEGIFFLRDSGPILHAWLADDWKAYDLTHGVIGNDSVRNQQDMQAISWATYIGIEMDTAAVVEFMRVTGYQGVLMNAHRAPELAQKCLPEGLDINSII